jgi:ParB/RepB/Spo0J family partition protein
MNTVTSGEVRALTIDSLTEHPDNPNVMSASAFGKLVRNIENTGLYEPVVVRPSPNTPGKFQIINGHHRVRALRKLNSATVNAVVWDIDDEQTDILLMTLNRLGGTDNIDRKMQLIKRLAEASEPVKLARLLPMAKAQIEKLASLEPPRIKTQADNVGVFAEPAVFMLKPEQSRILKAAMENALGKKPNNACQRAEAITIIAEYYTNNDLRDGQ